ncbi:MAG: hypothetical protein JWM71_805 [Solirubrobacteraceae bacterium]|nr:hypothetical protein [Solirubrobacteraceae bacterium]
MAPDDDPHRPPGPVPPVQPRPLAARGAVNSAVIAVGEITGKLASLALIAVLARKGGATAVGVWIYALSVCQITTMMVDFGMDRWILRQIAADQTQYQRRFPVILGLKALLTVPCGALTFGAVIALGASASTRAVVMILFVGFLLDALARAMEHVFSAFDRGALAAPGTIAQRVVAAGLGILALALGGGVALVAAAYVVGSSVQVVIDVVLLHRRVEAPSWRPRLSDAREVASRSLPFAVQDVASVLLFRVDAVILSVMAGTAVVGEYGAAYRLLEATMFIASSLAGGFAAMFTYLGRDTLPAVHNVFAGAIKLAVTLLAPIALILGLLAAHVMRLFYGAGLVSAASTLRILAPVVVLLGVVMLTSSMIVSREHPRNITKLTVGMIALNVGLNVALIPGLHADGAAVAMLVTEAAFAAFTLFITHRLIGPVPWVRSLASVVAAALAMAAVTVGLRDQWVAAGAAGLAVYAVTLVVVERRVAPGNLAYLGGLLRRRGAPA